MKTHSILIAYVFGFIGLITTHSTLVFADSEKIKNHVNNHFVGEVWNDSPNDNHSCTIPGKFYTVDAICEWDNEDSAHIPLLVKGDLNNDGAINIQDIIASINNILGNGEIIHGSDCNDDGFMNIQDVVCIINMV